MNIRKLFVIIGPGLLVAATGVGAGDLATGAFTGNKLGLAVLWAVLVGALLKFVINEGLTRWQLATGTTLLEGCVQHIGRPFKWCFLAYLAIWSFLVGNALMSATGATLHAIAPVFADAKANKLLYAALHSFVAVFLVYLGGYNLFEKVMTICIGIMFLIVLATAIALKPPVREVLAGSFIPQIPQINQGGLDWTVALMGGVGGTLTVLCYGYWIREENRSGPGAIHECRIDLAAGYLMTAIFGMAMVVIGSRMPEIKGGGATLLLSLANSLQEPFGAIGPYVKWSFLIGAWCAIFSSLLGVWQAMPYLFTDFCNLSKKDKGKGEESASVDERSLPYRAYLWSIATVPLLGVWLVEFKTAQKTYAVVGALIIPALAGILLYLNNRTKLVGRENKNSWITNGILSVVLVFFLYAGWLSIKKKFGM